MTLRALYVDFNSYFASVEQQLCPELRGKPVAVLPVLAETTCCIAASYEAKALGIHTGTPVSEARQLCPDIKLVEARPHLYIQFHHRLVEVVESCTHVDKTLSIDEMVCRLTGSQQDTANALALADRIKQAIHEQVGPYIRCSIGIAPNTFLSKVASNMHKPDGCVVIQAAELPERLYPLPLRQLNGIGRRMQERLARYGIESVQSLYAANRDQLRTAWGGIEGERMYDKLRGLEQHQAPNPRSSLGHSHVLPPELRNRSDALAVLHRLLQKACMRLRNYQLEATMIQVRVKFLNQHSWVVERSISATDDTMQLLRALELLWQQYPKRKAVPHAVGISFSGLVEPGSRAMDLFAPTSKGSLNAALDKLNMRYGKNTVYFGGAHRALKSAPTRIAFNHIPDLAIENTPNLEESPCRVSPYSTRKAG